MHKKGISLIFGGILTLIGTALISSGVFATQTCTTDSETNVITCSDSVSASVIITTNCSFTKTGSGEYSGVLANGGSVEVSGTTFTTVCNTPNGYALYAVGFSDDTVGNTSLIANIGSDYNIATGSSGSYWQMEMTKPNTSVTAGTIETGYDSYTLIPSTYTRVAYYTPAAGDTSTQTIFQPKYKAAASTTQPAGTYVGQVKYTLIPSSGTLSKIIYELTYLQDFSSLTSAQEADVLTSMIVGATYQLQDSSNDDVYYVEKDASGDVYVSANSDMTSSVLLSTWLENNAS